MKKQRQSAALLIRTLLLLALFLPLSPGRAEGGGYVGLVIVHGDGRQLLRCIPLLGAEQISGEEVLRRAEVEVLFDFHPTQGAAVCSIDGEGCPADNCFCECQGEDCRYWAYWHLVGGNWVYAGSGASNHFVGNGDVEGWVWGEGMTAPPPTVTFAEICGPEATPPDAGATPTPSSPTPTATPAPATEPTATPEPYVRFWSDPDTIEAGQCSTLYWQTDNVSTVIVSGRHVPPTGAMQICPCETTVYVLRAIYADGGEYVVSTQVDVHGTCADSPLATPAPPSTGAPTLPPATPADAPPTTATPPSNRQGHTSPLPTPHPPTPTILTPPPQPSAQATPGTTPPTASPTSTETAHNVPPRYDVEGTRRRPFSSRWWGYLAFGLLLMAIGGGYILVEHRRR